MRLLCHAVLGLLLLLGQELPCAAMEQAGTAARDHVLLKLKPGLAGAWASLAPAEASARLAAAFNLPAGTAFEEPAVNRLLAPTALQQNPARAGLNLERFLYVRLPAGLTVENCLARLRGHPWVEYAEPDGLGHGLGIIPNDPRFTNQWHHLNPVKPSASIQTPEAWTMTLGATNVIVALLDTGLTDSLTEFTNRVLPGWDFVNNLNGFADDHGHGSAVAGVLGANGSNATLVAGVDWRCRLLPVKVLDRFNDGYYSWWAQGIDYAVSRGAKILLLAAGGPDDSETIRLSISNALARGVLFITAAGNDGTTNLLFPGRLPECLTVGATDMQDRRCGFSSHGNALDLVAPGTNIYTVSRYGLLESWTGTSFAAPQVAGVCALLASIRPSLTQDQARRWLGLGADDQVGDATDTPGFDIYHGWGRLNAWQSLQLAQTRLLAANATNGQVRLSWPCPANASNRHPYLVEFTTNLGLTWATVAASNSIRYTNSAAFWMDDGAATGPGFSAPTKFYRIRLADLP